MPGNEQQESTMYYLLHKVLHLETFEDRIFDLENKNIELEVNYKILKSQLDKITHQSQNLDDADGDVTDYDYDGNENLPDISPILNENCGSNVNVNVKPIEIVCATLGNESESREVYKDKDVEEESSTSMSMGHLDIKVNSDEVVEVEDFTSNPAGFIDMFDQYLMDNVKNEPTNLEIDTTSIEIEDQKPLFDILPYEKLKLNLNPIVLLKRIDPSLCLKISTQKESKKKLPLKQSKAKTPKKSTKCQVEFEKEQPKKVSATITSKKSESYKCIICLKNINRNKLSTHYQSHKIRVDVKSQKFECKICPKLFQIRVDFVRHMREHLGMKLYECPICLRKFASSIILTTHMRVHTGEKPYSCTICKRKFSQLPSLRRHKRVHTGEKPYGCTFCPKFFRAKDHLVTHIRIHTGEKPYECSICSIKFSKKQTLGTHLKYKHKISTNNLII